MDKENNAKIGYSGERGMCVGGCEVAYSFQFPDLF